MKIALVTGVPVKGSSEIGAAYFTRALAAELLQRGLDVEIWSKSGCAEAEESQARVIPCWRPGWFAWFDIVAQVLKRKPVVLHIQHSMFVLGRGAAGETSMLLLLALLWLLGTRVVVTLHDIPALDQITPEYVRLHGYKFPAPSVTLGLRVLFWTIAFTARAIVVHQEAFADILARDFHIARRTIVVIPLLAMPVAIVGSAHARASLGLQPAERVVLFFGFATRYKGIELLLAAVRAADDPHLKLLLGAGEHPKVVRTPEYDRYYDDLKERARAIPSVQFLGFLPDAELDSYIDAADVAIFPYIEFQGMSGPLNICAAHKKPFLVSTRIAEKLPELSVCAFEPQPKPMAATLERFFNDTAYRATVEDACTRYSRAVVEGGTAELTAQLYKRIGG